MKIAIISDSHDNMPNIQKMLDYLKTEKIKVMLHLGDVCAPGVLKYLAENFAGDIYLVYGNVDGDRKKMEELMKGRRKVHLLGEHGEPKIKGLNLRIGMVHYPLIAKQMAAGEKYDVVFYGHDHKPWEEVINGTKIINPGTLAGLFAMATFAVYDTDSGKAILKILQKM
jgi:uncharacterized protein